jgi:osmotically-inducible protein OsmY
MKFMTAVLSGLVVVGLAVALTAAESNDVWLATKAKVALLTTEGVSVKDVDVAVVEGAVTLHGKVRTGAEKARAGYVVSAVEGVKSVKNLMLVAPRAFGSPGRIADDQVRPSVDSALRADRRLDGVKIASVENGVVVLEGTTANLEEKLRAIELAWAVPGVSRVTSRIDALK